MEWAQHDFALLTFEAGSSSFFIARFVRDRKINRSRNETEVMHLLVQSIRLDEIRPLFDDDPRPQDRAQETALAT